MRPPGACRATESVGAAPKRCPGVAWGGTGAHSLGWWSVGLDRRAQLTNASLQGSYTEARHGGAALPVLRRAEGLLGLLTAGERLRPEGEPRELSADHLQLVLRAGFVEPVDQRD